MLKKLNKKEKVESIKDSYSQLEKEILVQVLRCRRQRKSWG